MTRYPICDHNYDPIRKNPSQKNWTGGKRYLSYLKENIDFALICGGQGNQSSPSIWMQGGANSRRNQSLVMCSQSQGEPFCSSVLPANRVTWPARKVICPESLPPAKIAGFSSSIKHASPTATTHALNNLYNIVLY